MQAASLLVMGSLLAAVGCVSGILETMAIRAVDPSGCANELGLASSLARGCNDFLMISLLQKLMAS